MEPIASATAPNPEIRRLVRQHHVHWAVYPEWGQDANWEQQKVGFDLELTGTHFEPKHAPSAGCDECGAVDIALRRIAEFILPREVRPTKYDIDVFTGALQKRHPSDAPRVRVTIRLVHREGCHEPVDDCEIKCLAEMERALAGVGATRD